MFVTRKEFERHEERVERELEHLRNRYWELDNKHHALLLVAG